MAMRYKLSTTAMRVHPAEMTRARSWKLRGPAILTSDPGETARALALCKGSGPLSREKSNGRQMTELCAAGGEKHTPHILQRRVTREIEHSGGLQRQDANSRCFCFVL